MRPPNATLRALQCSRESLGCFFTCRLCPGAAPSVTAWSLTGNDHKHIDTGHPLPDFYLQNTCKFAIPSVAQFIALQCPRTFYPRFRTTHVSLSNFWAPIQSLCKGGDEGVSQMLIYYSV